MTKCFALIKWLGGEDDKKYTCGVPVEWVKDFDMDDFESEAFDASASYVIEWHTSKKEPPGGWPCYDGFVIAVSKNVCALNKILKAVDGIQSPRKVISSNTEHLSPTETVSKISEKQDLIIRKQRVSNRIDAPTNSKNTTKEKENNKDTNENNALALQYERTPIRLIEHNGEVENSKSIQDKGENDSESNSESTSNSDSHSNENVSGISVLKKNKTSGKDCSDIHDLLTGIRNELKKHRKQRQKRRRHDNSSSSNSSSDEDPSRIEVGRKGSGIFIADNQWRAARAQATYTAMGVTLLTAMFPRDVLLVSNLRGGKRKIARSEDSTDYQQLNQKTVEALYYTVEKAHRKTFNASTLGSAINNKLNRLRRKYKKNPAAQ